VRAEAEREPLAILRVTAGLEAKGRTGAAAANGRLLFVLLRAVAAYARLLLRVGAGRELVRAAAAHARLLAIGRGAAESAPLAVVVRIDADLVVVPEAANEQLLDKAAERALLAVVERGERGSLAVVVRGAMALAVAVRAPVDLVPEGALLVTHQFLVVVVLEAGTEREKHAATARLVRIVVRAAAEALVVVVRAAALPLAAHAPASSVSLVPVVVSAAAAPLVADVLRAEAARLHAVARAAAEPLVVVVGVVVEARAAAERAPLAADTECWKGEPLAVRAAAEQPLVVLRVTAGLEAKDIPLVIVAHAVAAEAQCAVAEREHGPHLLAERAAGEEAQPLLVLGRVVVVRAALGSAHLAAPRFVVGVPGRVDLVSLAAAPLVADVLRAEAARLHAVARAAGEEAQPLLVLGRVVVVRAALGSAHLAAPRFVIVVPARVDLVSLAHAQLAVERFIVFAPERERFLWCEEREEDAIGNSRSPLLLVIGVGDSHFRRLVLRRREGGTEVEGEGGNGG
jgi:hypothetical protein